MNNCNTCKWCKYIHTPSITGNQIDYICELKGSIIFNINIQNCDEMYERRKHNELETVAG